MLGKRIRELRKEQGLTQTELGQKVGVIKQTISSWENGISSPSNEAIAELAQLFRVTTDYLLGNLNTSSNVSIPKEQKIININDPIDYSLSNEEKKFLFTFQQLDQDNRDIILGEMKKYIKEQRRESVAADESLKRTGTSLGK